MKAGSGNCQLSFSAEQHFQIILHIFRQIRGPAGGNDVAIHNAGLIDPGGAGVCHIIFDAGRAGDRFAPQDIR